MTLLINQGDWSVSAMFATLESAELSVADRELLELAKAQYAERGALKRSVLFKVRHLARRIRSPKRTPSKIDQLAPPGAKSVPLADVLRQDRQIVAGARAYDALAAQARMVRPVGRRVGQ